METIITDTIKELQKKYTNLATALILVFTIAGVFTPLIIDMDNQRLTSISAISFIIMALTTFLTVVALITVLDEKLKHTKLSEKSIATFFVKNANHVEVNFATIMVILSLIYLAMLFLANVIFPVGIIIWCVTTLTLILQ